MLFAHANPILINNFEVYEKVAIDESTYEEVCKERKLLQHIHIRCPHKEINLLKNCTEQNSMSLSQQIIIIRMVIRGMQILL